MNQNEHAIFLDIPTGRKSGKFHSAILTTYAIDLIHFDHLLLNTLHRKQVCSVNVMVDSDQMNKSMEFVSPMAMYKVGNEYCVSPMNFEGAFHPKINFFAGDEAALGLLGTGNLTVAGQGKNHEVFSGFYIDDTDDRHRPLIEECWRYLLRYTDQCSAFVKNRILHEIPDNCSFLDETYSFKPHQFCEVQDNLKAALLYNEESSGILNQLAGLVPLNEVKKITVASPFFDENGETLITIANLCPNAKVDVLIQEKLCSLPPNKMEPHPRIFFYDFNETSRGQSNFSVYKRRLHAKIFHFKTDSTEYCLIGSANATIAGLGTMERRGRNEEFSVLYSSSQRRFLTELELTSRKKLNVRVNEMVRIVSDEESQSQKKIRITSADIESGNLTIQYQGAFPNDTFVIIDNGNDRVSISPQDDKKGVLTADVMLKNVTAICYLETHEGECVSNKLFVNNIEQLETTNPSQTSRSLNKFVSLIENEGYNGMDVANILSDIMWDLVNDSDETTSMRINSHSTDTTIRKKALPEIKYNAEYDNGDPSKSHIRFVDRTSRLVECIEESIRRKLRSIKEAINDEEEEGNTETSNTRDVQEDREIKVAKNALKFHSSMATSLLNRYTNMVDKREEECDVTGLKVITKDDLNFFSLSIFAALEICSLNRSNYQFGISNSLEKSLCQKKLYDNLDRSINADGLKALEKFTSFCKSKKKPVEDDEDFDKKIKRTMKYVVLYGMLFYKNASERDMNLFWPRVLASIKQLVSIFGLPSLDYLEEELLPISERYGSIFRASNIERLLKKLE